MIQSNVKVQPKAQFKKVNVGKPINEKDVRKVEQKDKGSNGGREKPTIDK